VEKGQLKKEIKSGPTEKKKEGQRKKKGEGYGLVHLR